MGSPVEKNDNLIIFQYNFEEHEFGDHEIVKNLRGFPTNLNVD